MRILVFGSDGYIGYPLTIHLLKLGHEVTGADNYIRRRRVQEIDGYSLTPIKSVIGRITDLNKFKNFKGQHDLELGRSSFMPLVNIIRSFEPDTIIHLAEQPSAAWSMLNHYATRVTQLENVLGTLDLLWAMKLECPEAHLIKLGTMGEYGTPNCDIPEGRIPAQPCDWAKKLIVACPMSGLLFPRTANSFYHLSKVHDTHNIEFACRTWNLRSTDIMQGIVFGLPDDPSCITRFDYDECFGTVINRFCTQAIIGYPLTIYGEGNQTRGFLTLEDSIKCITLAIENPPQAGEYRTFNQFENIYTINNLAISVYTAAFGLGLAIDIDHISNPRAEAEHHYYNPTHQALFDFGYVPDTNIHASIKKLISQILPYAGKVNTDKFHPKITWR